jgi:hypothetical protein
MNTRSAAIHPGMPAKRLKLRRPDTCIICSAELSTGTVASWDREARTITCVACVAGGGAPPVPTDHPPAPADDEGEQPGASLAREYGRRQSNRERRVREAHPHIGRLLLAWNDEPQHQRAFRQGEQGEVDVALAVAKAVDKVNGIVLHNRRMPGGRGDIDHIAIVPSGVYVIDAKAVTGTVEVRSRWFKPPLLFIGGRDRTTYLDGLDRQIQAVREIIEATGDQPVSVRGALCFTKADLPLLRTVEMRGYILLYRKALAKRLVAPGPLTADRCHGLAASLSTCLRPA